MEFYRQSWININLDALYHNLQEIKFLFPTGIYVIAVVKADAYGHGILPIARYLESKAVNYLAVASLDEAIFLRENGIRSPILVMGPVSTRDIQIAQFYNVTLTVTDEGFAKELRRYVVNHLDSSLKVHIKIDTGMRRLGLSLAHAEDVIISLFTSGLALEGIYTHFASADSDPDFTLTQINRFSGLLRRLRAKGIDFDLVHISNSAGLVYRRVFEGMSNAVRPGLALYGAYASTDLRDLMRLEPVLSLHSRISVIRELRPGEGLGYNHTYISDRWRRVAVLPIGYGDGYPRVLSNRGCVLIRERRCPIVGKICMDQLFVDVSELDEVRVGDEVVLIGRQGQEEIRVEEIASWCNTIAYELLCQLGRRLPRKYSSRRFRVSREDVENNAVRRKEVGDKVKRYVLNRDRGQVKDLI